MALKRDDYFQYAEGVKPVGEEKSNKGEVSDGASLVRDKDQDDDKPDVSELTVAEVHKLVEEGVLSPEDVFEAESNGKKRATLLAEYDPSK